MLKKGDQLSLAQPDLYRQLCTQLKPDDIATIIYTSGSTGDPKGVVLSHNNLCSQIVAAIKRYPLDHSKDRAFSALPLAHCFERTVVYTYFCQGVPIYFADDVQKLKEYLPIVEPTIMTMVPRILEKLYSKLHEKIDSSSSLIKVLGNWSMQVGHQDKANAMSKYVADKLLFKSGSYNVTSRAQEILAKVAKVINSKPDFEAMVEGHTDNVSYRKEPLLDNWDLSVKRSTSIIRVLQELGVNPKQLIAAGRAEYVPLVDNDTAENRAKNRRTRIVVLPKIDQFYDMIEKEMKNLSAGN